MDQDAKQEVQKPNQLQDVKSMLLMVIIAKNVLPIKLELLRKQAST